MWPPLPPLPGAGSEAEPGGAAQRRSRTAAGGESPAGTAAGSGRCRPTGTPGEPVPGGLGQERVPVPGVRSKRGVGGTGVVPGNGAGAGIGGAALG